jgi:hypothetical protein
MILNVIRAVLAASLLMGSQLSFAQQDDLDGAFLDKPYHHQYPQFKTKKDLPMTFDGSLSSKSDVQLVLNYQSAVKSQGARGTCSIFSATAYLEALLVKNNKMSSSPDLSEEWLQYLNGTIYRRDGSSSPDNISMLRQFGTTEESVMPYIGEDWKDLNFSSLSKERCEKVPSQLTRSCLIAHRDPRFLKMPVNQIPDQEFASARSTAEQFKKNFLVNVGLSKRLSDELAIKKLLAAGHAVLLDVDFFYGAWNHRLAEKFGMNRDMQQWSEGIVNYPEVGSVDRKRSYEDPAGHSILLVGYDDNKVIKTEVLMQDGTKKIFERKGVYYFKNSWGSFSFGSRNELSPGYGMITQDYAHEYGEFFFWQL